MVTAEEQGRETRARLMDAATQLIAERGWGAVTTRLVAERAGVRAGLVHYHFRSVDDLLIDAALRMMRRLAGDVPADLLGDTATGITALLSLIGGYDQSSADTRVFSEMLLAATRHERLRDGLAAVLAEFRATIVARLRADGSVPDPEATAVVLVAALDGLVLHRLIDPGLRELDLATPLLRIAGVRAGPGHERPRPTVD
ncbi:TetR/AcrR family transcriptional regulator [Nocardia sp. MDA0666]|uniref:TetR/AcrR family transcriptional regulator n=1 Tax=Nocardia sp. MDA0666 TaxID=2135448 RepID=UPI000D13CB0B|nr:TetR/AcrR family transcriptional regulator [Nocardia sp. MDA0666]PSR66427.1 TetR/AcrR family transcriptional regulator [Nocardia sp. MDA0666]